MSGETGAVKIEVDVWSDVMCPFCYMGDRLLERALAGYEHADAVTIRYRSFLLMPDLPVETAVDLGELLVARKGLSRDRADQMNAQVAARGREIGLDYRFDLAIATNTRRAHELSHFAAQFGKQHEMMQRLFKAYFTDGLNLGDDVVLARLAEEIGLDATVAKQALVSGRFADDVEEDLRRGRQLGITGVPFFVFNDTYALSGAQPQEAFVQVLERVRTEQAEAARAV